jgi:nucleotide-binding universal stress UspA family protein
MSEQLDQVGTADLRPFTRIVVGTDGSPQAASAIDRATRLASSSGAVLHVIFVIDTGRPHDRPVEPIAEEALQAANAAATTMSVKAEGRIVAGDPATRLMEEAHDRRGALLCVGPDAGLTAGPPRIGRVASRLVREASCPVLVARTTSRGFPKQDPLRHRRLGRLGRSRGVRGADRCDDGRQAAFRSRGSHPQAARGRSHVAPEPVLFRDAGNVPHCGSGRRVNRRPSVDGPAGAHTSRVQQPTWSGSPHRRAADTSDGSARVARECELVMCTTCTVLGPRVALRQVAACTPLVEAAVMKSLPMGAIPDSAGAGTD